MKIVLFGGSFDPLHKGHIKIIQEILKKLNVDRVFVCPTYLNPFKKEFHAPPHIRLRWLKKVLKKYPSVSICNYEVKQNRPVATIETVRYFYKYFNVEKIYLIIGADNLDSLCKWREFDKLKRLVTFVVATREGKKIPKNLKKLSVNVNISSTKLRENPDENYLPREIVKEVKEYYLNQKRE